MVTANGVFPCVRYGYVLIASLCVACATPARPATDNGSATTATLADTDLQAYDLPTLETRIRTMPDGPEREYFSGMLAARSGRFRDAVAQFNRALPHLRESDPTRAARALGRSRPPTGLRTSTVMPHGRMRNYRIALPIS
jgi:hypothetical protein